MEAANTKKLVEDEVPAVARLVECDGPDAGRAHDLHLGRKVVGRARSADVTVRDPDVSREHAALVVDVEAVRVVDLGSKNGVLVDGARIEGAREIEDGARIQIGGLTLELEHTASRVRRALRAGGEVTITRLRPEARPEAAASLRWPLLLTLVFGALVVGLALWGQ